MAITKNGEELNKEKREEYPRHKVSSKFTFREGQNGVTVPDMEFSQTHKFYEENFLDT
ncbi:hypothetical protein A2U01_0090054, partial [Trifolium medium]|nr:hypothetical protein [Trifolium medium]